MRLIKIYPLALGLLFLQLIAGCNAENRELFLNLDNTGTLSLNHYTSLLPSLGPCGFSRNFDYYSIIVPRTYVRMNSDEINIHNMEQDTVQYKGYIEFLSPNKIFVQLSMPVNGKQIPLSINGKHTLKVIDNGPRL